MLRRIKMVEMERDFSPFQQAHRFGDLCALIHGSCVITFEFSGALLRVRWNELLCF